MLPCMAEGRESSTLGLLASQAGVAFARISDAMATHIAPRHASDYGFYRCRARPRAGRSACKGHSALVCGSVESRCRSVAPRANEMLWEGGDVSVNPEVMVERRPRGGRLERSWDGAWKDVH